jgi:hypothetical protein
MQVIGTDLLSKIRDELDARLRELRPLLAEYERLLAAAAALEAPVRTPAPAPARRRGRPPGRPQGDRSASETPARVAASPAARRAGRVPKPAPKRAARGAAGVAIVAALEHGSHTVSELVIVTALSGTIINGNLHRLRQAGTITRTKRPGDGKAAYALASTVA